MNTTDILACGIVTQSFTWPAATVFLARHFSRQLRLSAPPKEQQPDEELLGRLAAAMRDHPGVNEMAAIGHKVVEQEEAP